MPALCHAFELKVCEENLAQLEHGKTPARHAVTLQQGQREVLLMLGEFMARHIRASHQRQQVAQQECDFVLRLVLAALAQKLQRIVNPVHHAELLLLDDEERVGKISFQALP